MTKGLDLNHWGYIAADEYGRTSRCGVWAGGDIVTGSATVILAMGAGKAAARDMQHYPRSRRKCRTELPIRPTKEFMQR